MSASESSDSKQAALAESEACTGRAVPLLLAQQQADSAIRLSGVLKTPGQKGCGRASPVPAGIRCFDGICLLHVS